jgi:hypothetical protein
MDTAKPQDLFRTDCDEIIFAEVKNRQKLDIGGAGILSFYKNNIDSLEKRRPYKNFDYAADKKINIDVDIKEYDLDEILKISEELSKKINV